MFDSAGNYFFEVCAAVSYFMLYGVFLFSYVNDYFTKYSLISLNLRHNWRRYNVNVNNKHAIYYMQQIHLFTKIKYTITESSHYIQQISTLIFIITFYGQS